MRHHRAQRALLACIAAVALGNCQTEQAVGPAFDEAAPIAQLEFRTGAVTLQRGDSRTFAELGYVLPNDAFETGPDATMQLRFPSGATVEVGPDARLSVVEDKAGSAVKASRGSYLARMPPHLSTGGSAARAFLTLQTPFGFTRCDSDGEISVQVGPEAARIQIRRGKVEVGSKTGRTMVASPGDQFLLSSAELERLPAPSAAAEKKGPSALGFQVRGLDAESQADLRRKDARNWVKVAARGEKLSEHDVLRVWSGNWVVEWGRAGSRLVANEGAELSVETSDSRSNGEPAVSLRKGEVWLSVENEAPERLAISGMLLGTQAPGYFLIARTSDGLELTALAGDLSFKKEGVEGKVLAGQKVTVHGSEKAIVEDLERADLALSPRFGFKIFHQGLDRLALTWDGGKKDFRLEVAADSAFAQPVLRGTVHRSFVNLAAPSKGALFWRVLDKEGTAVARGSASFSGEQSGRESGEDADGSAAPLVVRSPKNGELVKGNRIVASGVAPAGSRVLVNGKAAPIDERSRFELAVAPVGRPPLAIFRLLRTSEPEVIVVRVLRRAK